MAEQDSAVRAGHISFEQAEGMAGRSGKAPLVGPRAGEMLAYFSAVALAVATLVLAYDIGFDTNPFSALAESLAMAMVLGNDPTQMIEGLFDDFQNVSAGMVVLLGAAILVVWGIRLARHRAGAIRRSAGFTFLIGYMLSSIAFGFLLLDLDLGDATPLVKLLPIAVVALIIWMEAPSVPTQLALFSTAVSAISAILVLVQAETVTWLVALVSGALGLAWIWLGHTGRVRTRNTAFFLGAYYAFFNIVDLFGLDDWWIILSIALAAGFVWGASRWQSSVLGGFATVAVVVLITQVISLLIDEPSTMTFIVGYGVPGLLALAAAWYVTGSGPTSVAPAMPTMPPAPTPAAAMPVTASTTTATTAKKPAAKKPATAKKPVAKKAAATAKKPTATKKATTTAKKPTAAKAAASKKAASAKKPTPKKKPTR